MGTIFLVYIHICTTENMILDIFNTLNKEVPLIGERNQIL